MDWPSEWLLVGAALLLALYILGTWPYDYFKKRNIQFVKPTFLVGNLGSFTFRRASFGDNIVNLYNSFKGYSVAGYFEFLTPVVMIRDPEIIRMISVKDFDYFTDHRAPIREDVDPLFGRNMFSLQGQRWRDMRNTLSPAFTSSKMKSMFLLLAQIGTQLGDHLEQRCKASKDGLLTLEMKDLFTRYANDVIATSAFGLQCDSLRDPNNEFYKVGKEITNFSGVLALKFMGFLFSARLMKILNIKLLSEYNSNFFRSLVHSTMETREREHIVRPDMIHLLMEAKRGTLTSDVTERGGEESKRKMELSDDDITANALLFFLAGFDTVSTLMCFMSHLLAMHPDVQRRVQQEMDAELQADGGKITYEGLQKMKYLDTVISETLRLYPPAVAGDRMCSKPYVIAATSSSPAVHLNIGDGISIPTIAIQRDPEFFPDPMKFDPERFNDDNKHNIKPFTYLPFGLGPRNCIGMRFAQMESKVALTSLLTRFDLEVVSKTPIPIVLDRTKFNMVAEGGFWLGIRPRNKAAI